jgi:bacterial/archaeal transporter family protein
MQPWQMAALGAACCIGAHYLLLRAATGRVGDTLGALILETTAAIGIALGWALGLRGNVATTRAGVVYAALSGLFISVGSILIFYALRRGGPVASTGTIVLGGGVTISAILAPLVFREAMSGRRLLGVALGIAALIVLATEAQPPERESHAQKETP